jgi:WD40 repeat protein
VHLGSIWSVIWSVAWSPDGKWIASGGNDSTVQVWDASTGHRLFTLTGHTAPVRGVAWSPDGTRIASASQDGTVRVWDARSGHLVLTYRAQTAPLWAVAWSPNMTCIASATGNTNFQHQKETVQIWDPTSGHLYNSYPIPSSADDADGTMSVSWSPDSKYVASGGADSTVHLWATSSCTP